MTFLPSPQQAAVFDWVSNGEGNLIIEAVAGAGKTTTLIEALSLTAGRVQFVAFNKKIADEISAKVAKRGLAGRVKAGTFHSAGFAALRKGAMNIRGFKARIDEKARRQLLIEATDTPEHMQNVVFDLFNFARHRGFGPLVEARDFSNWERLIEHYSLDERISELATREEVARQAYRMLAVATKRLDAIDFNDMLWLPLALRLPVEQTPWVFVDEAQDTNPVRRALAARMLADRGRAVFVGDPCQAIYGFTGADNGALDLIAEEFKAARLPLTVTYRCPKAVVNVARMWVSHIEAHETAPEGTADKVDPVSNWTDALVPGDAVLCRNTAPLVEMAYKLIAKRKPAHVEGRDIGRGLVALTRKWAMTDIDAWLDRLEDWSEQQIKRMQDKGQNLAAQSLEDRVATLRLLANDCGTLDDLRAKIESIFADTKPEDAKSRITLSTIHKSKGREWERVYWFGRNLYQPSRYAKLAWEQEQERNLMYVAATRSQDTLLLVE